VIRSASFFFGLAAGILLPAVTLAQASPDLEKRLARAHRQEQKAMPGTPVGKAVASEFGEIGAAYLARGDTARAIELLEEAYSLDSDNGLLLAHLTLAYVRAEDFPFAHFYLELAEERAPRAPPQAYAVLGEVYYALNRLEDAVLAWDHFRRLGGADPRVLARLDRARQELSPSSRQGFLNSEDFAFFFDAAIPRELVERADAHLKQSYEEQAGFFGRRLPATQVVLLYARRAYFTLVSVPDWVSGMYDGKIRVAADPDGGFTPSLGQVLSHELAHALVRASSRDHAPGWLHEGLAQWWEGKRIARAEFRQMFRGSAPLSLASIEGNLARRADRAAARNNYLEALGLVEYLMQERGPGAVTCIVQDLGEGVSVDEALRRETEFSADDLVSRWKAWAGL
jgi:tetratricopeptide (TPR) repeat protein